MKTTLFQERHSAALRLWHWSTLIVTCLLLFSIAVSKTFLSGPHAGFVIDHAAARKGIHMNFDQVREIIGSLRQTIWKWHIRFGYFLSGLFVFRIMIEFFQPRELWFSSKVKRGIRAIKNKEERKTGRHYLIVKSIYFLFYGLMAAMVISGLWLAWHRNDQAITEEQFHSVKEIHEASFNFLLLFLLIHLVGVIRAERGKHRNIVSAMINGGKYSE